MIKSLVFTILACLVLISTQAQSSQNATMTVTLTSTVVIALTDIAPALVFTSGTDYQNGVTHVAPAAGTVTATGPFSVSVRSTTAALTEIGGDEIAVNTISVQATGSDLGTTSTVNLSTADATIIAGAPAGLAKIFGLSYATSPGSSEFYGKTAGAYAGTLVYTATLD